MSGSGFGHRPGFFFTSRVFFPGRCLEIQSNFDKEEQGDNPPEQKTPELKALVVTEGEPPEKVSMHGTFTKAMTPMHPSKYIDLASDDDDPSGAAGSETTTTAVKLEVKTESQPCALLEP